MSRRLFRYSAAALLLAVGPTACVDDAPGPDEPGTLVNDTQVADAQSESTTALKPVDFDVSTVPSGSLVWQFEGYVDPATNQMEILDMRRLVDPAQHASGLRTLSQAGYCEVDADNDGTPGSGAPDTVELVTTNFFSLDPFTWTPGGQCDAPLNAVPSASSASFAPEGVTCGDVTVRSFYSIPLHNVYARITEFGGNGFHLAYPSASVPVGMPSGAAALGLWSYGELGASGGNSVNTWYFRNGDSTPFTFRGIVVAEIDEQCGDATDDDCDGRVNEGCYEYLDGADCEDDADCVGALCDGGTCGLGCWNYSIGSDTGSSVITGDWAGASSTYSICGGSGADVSVRFVAPATGVYTFDTDGSSDTVMALYDNTDQLCGTTTSLGCDDDGGAGTASLVADVTLTAGQEVLIVIKRYSGSTGNWILNVSSPVVCGDGFIGGSEECDDGAGNSDLAADACRLDCSAAACGDGVLDTGETCDDGNLVSGDGCSSVCELPGIIPCADGDLGSATGAAVASGSNGPFGNTYDGSADSCSGGSGNDVSFAWTAAVSGTATIDTLGSSYDTVLSVYDGTALDCAGAEVTCNDDIPAPFSLRSSVEFPVTAGDVYFIVIDGYSTTPGDYVLNIALPICGDGVVEGAEQCDDGVANSDTADNCRTDCTNPVCGDGILDTGEACDDGNLVNGDTCTGLCQLPGALPCADGDLGTATGAAVASGNNSIYNDDYPSGSFSCTSFGGAGRDVTFAWEAPSTGTAIFDTEGSSFDTILEVRDATGLVCNGTELACDDDGGTGLLSSASVAVTAGTLYHIRIDGYTITPGDYQLNITLPICGDGVIEGAEVCDDGAGNSDVAADACRTDCNPAACGDGVTDTGETCDDGNLVNGDACTALCQLPGPLACSDGDLGTAVGASLATGNTGAYANAHDGTTDSCNGGGGNDVSYTWEAPFSGTVTIDTNGSSFDTVLSVYNAASETCSPSLTYATEVSCDDDGGAGLQSLATFPVVGGELYLIIVDGYSGTGNYVINITLPVCGDGVIEGAEACDDGAGNSDILADACRTDCTAATCGDGTQDTGEACDDGNLTNGDGCQADCSITPAPGALPCADYDLGNSTGIAVASGDLSTETDEGIATHSFNCNTSGSGTDARFRFQALTTGNYTFTVNGAGGLDTSLGIREGGNGSCTDTVFTCTDNTGGNGVESVTRAMTAGDVIQITVSSYFTSNSTGTFTLDIIPPPVCGNGLIESGEACDDGNGTGADGCTSCAVDIGYACAGAPSVCAATCGNGVDNGEACDDGNNSPGDGCSAACTVEAGFTCAGFPSACACTGSIGAATGVAVASGDTSGGTNTYNGGTAGGGHTCQSSTASNDTVVIWTAPATYSPIIDLSNSAIGDTVISVRELAPGTCFATNAAQVACDDDDGTGNRSTILSGELTVTAGTTYMIIVDGWSTGNSGVWQLDISAPPVCGNGTTEPGETCDDGNLTNGDGCEDTCTPTPVTLDCATNPGGFPAGAVVDVGGALGDVATFNIANLTDTRDSSCRAGGREGLVEWTAPATGLFRFHSCNSAHSDTAIWITDETDGACDNSNVLACNDDESGAADAAGVTCAGSFRSYTTLTVTAGNTYLVGLETYSTSTTSGSMTVTITGPH